MIMSDIQNEAVTTQFLKTNGPDDGEFDPPPDFLKLLEGKSDADKALYISNFRQEKKLGWLIRNTVGLKGASRLHKAMLDGLVQDMAPWKHIRDQWLTGKKAALKILMAVAALSLLPAIGTLASDLVKPWLMRLFHIHP